MARSMRTVQKHHSNREHTVTKAGRWMRCGRSSVCPGDCEGEGLGSRRTGRLGHMVQALLCPDQDSGDVLKTRYQAVVGRV